MTLKLSARSKCILTTSLSGFLLTAAQSVSAIEKEGQTQAKALVLQGETLILKRRFADAEKDMRMALQLDPKCAAALLGMSRICRLRNNQKLSFSFLETAMHLEPNNYKCYLECARIYQSLQRYDAAITASKKSVALSPDNPDAALLLGWNQSLTDDKEAEKSLRRAIALNPHIDFPLQLLGNDYWNRKKLDQAKQCFEDAIKVAPKNPENYRALGGVLYEQGKKNEAKAIFVGMEKNFPKDPEPFLLLSVLARKEGNDKEREALLHRATEIQPSNDQAWRELALLYMMHRKIDESLRCARIAQGARPRSPYNNFLLAVCLMEIDKPQDAEPYMEKAVEYARTSETKLEYEKQMVGLRFIIGKNDQAMELAKQMYKEAPQNLSAISAMAWALICFKRYDEGLAMVRQAMIKFPNNNSLEYEYLDGMVSAERYPEARKLARQLIAKSTKNSEAWMLLLEVARKTHNKKEAEEALKHLDSSQLSAGQSMEIGFNGIAAGAGNKALPSLRNALLISPDSADLILNTRDPADVH